MVKGGEESYYHYHYSLFTNTTTTTATTATTELFKKANSSYWPNSERGKGGSTLMATRKGLVCLCLWVSFSGKGGGGCFQWDIQERLLHGAHL